MLPNRAVYLTEEVKNDIRRQNGKEAVTERQRRWCFITEVPYEREQDEGAKIT